MFIRSGLVTLALICVTFLIPHRSGAASSGSEKTLIGVLDFEPVGSTKIEAIALSDGIRQALLASGQVALVDRSQLSAVMDEQALQQSICSSQECAIKVGKVLGVRELVTGRLIKLSDGVWQVSALLVDVETAETLKVASVLQEGNLVLMLQKSGPQVATTLFPPVGQPSVSTPVGGAGSPPSPNAVPGRSLTLAMFPWSFTGQPLHRGTIENGVTQALQNTPGVRVTYTWYPELTPGKSLRGQPAIADQSRTGFFVKGPNVSFIQAKGKELNVDAVLLLDTNQVYNPSIPNNPITIAASFISVRTGKVYEGNRLVDPSKDRSAFSTEVEEILRGPIVKLRNAE